MSYNGVGNSKLRKEARRSEMEKCMCCCKAMKTGIYYWRLEGSQTLCDVQHRRWQIGLIYTTQTTHRSIALCCQSLVLQWIKRLSLVLASFEECLLPYLSAHHSCIWNVIESVWVCRGAFSGYHVSRKVVICKPKLLLLKVKVKFTGHEDPEE
jgi:hypothetical protein